MGPVKKMPRRKEDGASSALGRGFDGFADGVGALGLAVGTGAEFTNVVELAGAAPRLRASDGSTGQSAETDDGYDCRHDLHRDSRLRRAEYEFIGAPDLNFEAGQEERADAFGIVGHDFRAV